MTQLILKEKQMWILSWNNRFGKPVSLTHQYDTDVYKWGEILYNEGKDISVCPME